MMVVFLILSRVAVNKLGAEGARVLAEPLGKLTSLQTLVLDSTLAVILLLD